MTIESQCVILGGGIAGLAAARSLRDRGYSCLLFERCPTYGGLTRTVEVGEFCFDYTGHFLHLDKCRSPSEIPFAGLSDDDWFQVERKSYGYLKGRLITAPVQYHLGELSPDDLAECVKSYHGRPEAPQGKDLSFRDYIISGFGEYLADLFLIPQNEKTMATSLDRLSSSAVKRFFPRPDEQKILEGIEGTAGDESGYNAMFWYPKIGGIGRLVRGLSQGLDEAAISNEEIIEIDLRKRFLKTASGRTCHWDVLFSSIPLPVLCRATKDDVLTPAADELTYSTTISFNLGLRGSVDERLRDAHWIYLPDRSEPCYRVGFYSNISGGSCASGFSTAYAEVGLPGGSEDVVSVARSLQSEVLASLEKLGWIYAQDVVCVVAHVIPHAYVHFTPRREELMPMIRSRLEQHGVHLIGRYGLWDYISMEDAILSAISKSEEVSA